MVRILKHRQALAEYYNRYYLSDHRIYFEKLPEKKDVNFAIRALGRIPESVCDIGCGEGRHLVEFQKRGVKKGFGFDDSRSLVKLASRKFEAGGNFVIRKMSFSQWRPVKSQFDLVFSFFSSFSFCLSFTSALSLAKKMYIAVKPGGLVCVDLDSPYRLRRFLSGKEKKFMKGGKGYLAFNTKTGILFSREYYGNKILETKTRYFTRDDLKIIFVLAGAPPGKIFFRGGIDGQKYTKSSSRLIVLIKK